MIDCEESVFTFQQVSGVVKADSRVTLAIRFTPSASINFYRRITCLVHNQVFVCVCVCVCVEGGVYMCVYEYVYFCVCACVFLPLCMSV